MAEALAHSMVVLSGMRILNFLQGTFDIQIKQSYNTF